MGNRILKKLLDVDTQKTTKTFYTRDAQGNVLSIYENGKQKTYRDDRDNIYYFNAQNELINYTDATGKNLFTFNIKGKLIFEKGQAFVCIDKINWGNCNDKIQLTDITDENLITQTEVPIYGSDRIGTYNPPSETNINSDIYILNRSYKRYELKDHLGNVRVIVSDSKRVSFVSETLVFSADIKTYTDYYAFGMEMVGRNWSEGEAYRFGHNGQEKSKEVGEDNYTAEFWEYDSQVIRRFNLDPKASLMPFVSPYNHCLNSPIFMIDPDGDLPWPIHFRSFISTSSVGGGLFRGDGRYPSLSTAKSVTSRVNFSFTYDPSTKKMSNNNIYSDPTVFYGVGAPGTMTYIPPMVETSKPNFMMTSLILDFNELNPNLKSSRSTFGFKYDAKDPITPDFATPSLDVHANLFFDENIEKGILTIGGKVFGDKFPSTEAFILDQSGKGKIFLGAIKENGGVGDLFGDNKLDLFSINMTIKFDKKGNFMSVKQGDKTYTVDQWNKQVLSNWDKKK